MDNTFSIQALFSARVFSVPDYQRGYSWDTQQITEFLEDLELLSASKMHYTGTVILHPSKNVNGVMDKEGNLYSNVNIVDGQQRLTTIVLLLDALRRVLGENGTEDSPLADGIKKNFIAAENTHGQPLFKLSLNQDTDHFFKHGILGDKPSVEAPKNTSERRLQAAQRQISDYLNKTYKKDDLPGLYQKIVAQLQCNLYEIETDAELGVIFEVVNNRGKPLTDLEKVKNYLLYAASTLEDSTALAKPVNGAWSVILSQLMAAGLVSSADEDRLLRAHWLAHYNPQSRDWKGSKSIKGKFDLRTYIDKDDKALDDLLGYTQSLRESSISFCDAYSPDREDAFGSFKGNPHLRDQVIEWSLKLRRIGVVQPFLPLFMAVRERWPDAPEKYLTILKLCENFGFRVYRLIQARADAGQSDLFHLGYEVAHYRVDFEDAVTRIKSMIAYRCSNDLFDLEMHREYPKEWYGWGGLQYFLYEYEVALTAEQLGSPKVAWREIRRSDRKDTIEHVLPQTIENQPYWQGRFTDEDHRRYMHDLGNLTLTKFNPQLGNKPFPEKKGSLDRQARCYAQSLLSIETDLCRWDDWNTETIDQRRRELIQWAKKRWSVDLTEVKVQDTTLEVDDFFEEIDGPSEEDNNGEE